MANEIIFVGAGPIGLWTAVQLKLQRPDLTIVFKEKYAEYQRLHTLKLESGSFADCVYDADGVIKSIVDQVRKNPNIRTDLLEGKLLALALSLGITIDRSQKIEQVEEQLKQRYPDAAMIIGSDGVRSQVRDQIFGQDNAHKTSLAYSAQIKYFVNESATASAGSLQTYPLLKQSKFLSFVSVGKTHEGRTPVTIQHIIDKETYDVIQNCGFHTAVKIFSDDLEKKLPADLLEDIKTQVGFRLANKEDIIVDSVNLTATELPQQRCDKTVLFRGNKCYALIGDAALALSYFRGMNSGLQLATQFSKAVVVDWDKIVARDESALENYEKYYQTFANTAFASGHRTNSSLGFLNSSVHVMAKSPIQLTYYSNAEIAEYHRRFNLLHQINKFHLGMDPAGESLDSAVKSVDSLNRWVEEQTDPGLEFLRKKIARIIAKHHKDLKLCHALNKLADIPTKNLGLYEKGYLALAMSKACELVESPTEESHQQFSQFIASIKTPKPGFFHMLSAILELIAGVVAVGLGIVSLVGTFGSSAPLSVSLIAVGALCASHGIFQLAKNVPRESATYQAAQEIAMLSLNRTV